MDRNRKPIKIEKFEQLWEYTKQTTIECVCPLCGKVYTCLVLSKRRRATKDDFLLCKACRFKQTNLKKYGVDNAMKSKKIVEKLKQNNFEKYGVTCTLNTEDNIKKKKNTWMKNFCATNPYQKKEIREKVKKNNFEKYGTEYAITLPQVKDKAYKTKLSKGYKSFNSFKLYRMDSMYFDSSWEVFFYIWHKDHNIKIERNKTIFKYMFEGKIHHTFVDFTLLDCFHVEIKAPFLLYKDAQQIARNNMLMYDENVIFITDISNYRKYVNEKYGKNYIKQFKIR